MYRRLNRHGLFGRRPAICIPLTNAHRGARNAWCREHNTWTMEQWSQVLFTDESGYSLNSVSSHVMIWLEPGTRYLPTNILERDKYGGGGIMVWGGIIMGSRTPLHVFDRGIVTGQVYRDVILQYYVCLFRGAVGPTFLLMDDNAQCSQSMCWCTSSTSHDSSGTPVGTGARMGGHTPTAAHHIPYCNQCTCSKNSGTASYSLPGISRVLLGFHMFSAINGIWMCFLCVQHISMLSALVWSSAASCGTRSYTIGLRSVHFQYIFFTCPISKQ